jgi:NAD(P)-dependent dehydrogenase (short-subunit alcohol dehydrogenase family)
MSSHIDLSGRVAAITGAGGGLGREYALELARQGAKVVVNDMGTSVTGEGHSSQPAAEVVKEIIAGGGEAIASTGSVTSLTDMQSMVDQALTAFGRLDILVANAGILSDGSFKKMTIESFEAVVDVHLLGTARAIKAAWESMTTQGYGRIVLTTSTTGLFGNFGQANYAAAKAGIFGLMNTLKLEGVKYGVHVNCISPFAATRMSAAQLPAGFAEIMHPRYVAPAVAYLASEKAPNGVILNAGAGKFSISEMVETAGAELPLDEVSASRIGEIWAQITDQSRSSGYASAVQQAAGLIEHVSALIRSEHKSAS